MFKAIIFTVFVACAVMPLCTGAEPFDCQTTNPALEAMQPLQLIIVREDGSYLTINAKLAENNRTRAAGFQRVCESTIAASPILFRFEQEVMPRFHMNNVVAPIDIAFIDKQGRIESIQSMRPYVIGAKNKPLYSPSRPIIAALEVHKNFFNENKVDLSSKVSWQQRPDTQSDKQTKE